MSLWQNYLRPKSLEQALRALTDSPAPTCIIAGGSDLLLELQQGRHPAVQTLVDVSGVTEMTRLEMGETGLFIGAAVPVSRVADSPLVQEQGEALVEACRLIAGPQVRNVATLGGNVAHALPAADGTIALMCLDVQAQVASLTGMRLVPFGELFEGAGKSTLKKGEEILVGFHIPAHKAGQASAFRRVMRQQGIALPILNLSVWLEREQERIRRIRIVPGPAGTTPRRMKAAEEACLGVSPEADTVQRAYDALLAKATFRTSPQRASADYRRHLAGVLLEETLRCAWERAGKRMGRGNG